MSQEEIGAFEDSKVKVSYFLFFDKYYLPYHDYTILLLQLPQTAFPPLLFRFNIVKKGKKLRLICFSFLFARSCHHPKKIFY